MSEPLDPAIEEKVRDSFAKQSMMTSIGTRLDSVGHGKVVISAPILEGFRQQQDLAHGGLVFSLSDTAAGYTALSVMPIDMEVVTVEVKINLMAPAEGRLVATGRVLKPGKCLVVVANDIYAENENGQHIQVAALQCTMIPVQIQLSHPGMKYGRFLNSAGLSLYHSFIACKGVLLPGQGNCLNKLVTYVHFSGSKEWNAQFFGDFACHSPHKTTPLSPFRGISMVSKVRASR